MTGTPGSSPAAHGWVGEVRHPVGGALTSPALGGPRLFALVGGDSPVVLVGVSRNGRWFPGPLVFSVGVWRRTAPCTYEDVLEEFHAGAHYWWASRLRGGSGRDADVDRRASGRGALDRDRSRRAGGRCHPDRHGGRLSPQGGEVGHNEELIARALREYGSGAADVLVATKGGHLRPGDGTWTLNGDPQYVKRAAKESARRLGVEAIGLYQFHRPDPAVPYAESVGALSELLDEGVILMAGISNADVTQIDVAQEVLGGRLVSVQNQFSPAFRSSLPELERCAELGIAFLPWSPLGGIANAKDLAEHHGAFQQVADEVGVSVHRVTLAWELALAPVVVPIPGASRPESIRDSAAAADLDLTAEQVARLSA